MSVGSKLNEELVAFRDEALELSKRIPPGAAPCPWVSARECAIYMGPPSAGRIESIRRSLHWPSFILAVHPAEEEGDAAALKASLPPWERTVFVAARPGGGHAEFAGLLVGLLKCVRVRILVDGQAEQDPLMDRRAVETAVKEAQTISFFLHLENLIRMRAAACNIVPVLRGLPPEDQPASGKRMALVCGAGPSLGDSLPAIMEFRDRICLVAVGHAAAALSKGGAEPDFVVEIDPMGRSNHPGAIEYGSTLAATIYVDPLVPPRFKRHVWIDDERFALASMNGLLRPPSLKIRSAISVIVAAISFAEVMGFKRIALAGSDLCLSASGASHAGERQFEGDGGMFKEIRGEDGETYVTTQDFLNVRRHIAEHAAGLDGKTSLVNCTHRGLPIPNVPSCDLRELCIGLPEDESPSLGGRAPAPCPEERLPELKRVRDDLRTWQRTLSEMSGLSKRMLRNLSSPNPDLKKMPEMQSRLKEASDLESGLWHGSPARPFAEAVKLSSFLFLSERAGMRRAASLEDELEASRLQMEFTKDICEDVERDVSLAIETLEGGGPPPASPVSDSLRFTAFQRFAVSFILSSNRELASRMEEASAFGGVEGKFALQHTFQSLPVLKRICHDGSQIPLSGYLSMDKEADASVEAFLKKSGYDARRHAVVFLAPGNWADVCTFARRRPEGDCKLMVVEPWPELLCEIVSHSMFLHLLPPGSPVIAMHDSLPGWRRLFTETLRKWGEAGLETLFYKCPSTWKLEEVRELFASILPPSAEE